MSVAARLAIVMGTAAALSAQALRWERLPDLPQALAGQFVGVHDGALIVAGGSYWTAPPWRNGVKVFSDAVYTLRAGDAHWKQAGRLPEPVAYGAAISTRSGLICAGGQQGGEFTAHVWLLAIENGAVVTRRLPSLPYALAMHSGAQLHGQIYLAGGQRSPDSSMAQRCFLTADLAGLAAGRAQWQELPPWPGRPRFLAQMAALSDRLHLAGGSDLIVQGGLPERVFLDDAYEYQPQSGWRALPNLPRPLQAAPAIGLDGLVLIFGGNDGQYPASLREKHPGFRPEILTFSPGSRVWCSAGRVPVALVTTGAVQWNQGIVIAGGEDRPGSRSAAVYHGKWMTAQGRRR